MIKLNPGNIWSGSKRLAVFTNPTELAFKKHKLKNHYPVYFLGVDYPDAESAYQANTKNCKGDFNQLFDIMKEIIICKFKQHPLLFTTIEDNDGVQWIRKCRHVINGNRWEGIGYESPFIRALAAAYWKVKSSKLNCTKCGFVDPVLTESGPHIKASCPDCNSFIKFVKQ